MNNEHSDWIYLHEIGFPCIVGLYDEEQRTPQALEIELAMGLDLDAAAGGELSHSVHYVAALDQVQFIAEEGRWRLLESLAAAIARHLLRAPAPGEGRAAIERVKVRVGKPGYLQGRALPSVEITRGARWAGAEPLVPAPGEVRLHPLQLTRQSGAYHVDFGAGGAFVVPEAASAFVLAGRLAAGGVQELARGAVVRAGARVVSASPSARLLLVASRPLG